MAFQLPNLKHLCSALLVTIVILGCSEDSDKAKKPAPKQTSEWSLFGNRLENSLQVSDEAGAPIAGAKVLIGNGVDSPFRGNLLTTDLEGRVLIPAAWSRPEMVTISAAQFVRATYLSLQPSVQRLVLRRQFGAPAIEVGGLGTGFTVKDFDKKADFAVMMSALRKTDFFTFDLAMVISPQMDKIEVVGREMNIPSNVSLPKQKETYFVTITLDKPTYRTYFNELGQKTIFAVRGQFPFSKVVDEMRDGKQFFDLINHFDLKGGTIRELSVTTPKTVLDIPVNELNFNETTAVKAPSFASDQYMMMVAASEYKGQYLPTDIKNVESNKIQNLKVAAGSQPFLISILKPKGETAISAGRLSAAMQPMIAGVEPEMMPIMPAPRVENLRKVSFQRPSGKQGLQELATYSMLSKVEKRMVGKTEMETVTRLWDVYGAGWIDGFTLPTLPGDAEIAGSKRWEVSMVGSQITHLVDLGPKVFETATHASLTFADF